MNTKELREPGYFKDIIKVKKVNGKYYGYFYDGWDKWWAEIFQEWYEAFQKAKKESDKYEKKNKRKLDGFRFDMSILQN